MMTRRLPSTHPCLRFKSIRWWVRSLCAPYCILLDAGPPLLSAAPCLFDRYSKLYFSVFVILVYLM